MKGLKNAFLLLALLTAQAAWADIDVNKEAHSALFLNISGWMNKGLLIKKRVNLNQAFDRSPDPLEFKSIEDTFKINMELFKKDPDYKCRRPSFYHYFSHLLGEVPFPNNNCKINHQVTLIAETALSSTPMVSRNIDPKRIYQIHYLFAGKGKAIMSRWGHAMFRLVLCAPSRTTVGPECLQDYAHHVVVSYRANVEDMHLSYAKGMNGAYASQLFLMNMSEVVAEYTKGEFRDVLSLPLKMNNEQIANFTNKLLENYWSYRGRYYFITNNCATEAMNLLRTAYPENEKIQTANIVTPLGLYDYVIKNKIADIDVLNNKNEAIKRGYLFSGISEKLERSLGHFAQKDELGFEDFALKMTPAQRKDLYEKKLSGDADDLTQLANALRLEEQIQMSREQQFAKKLGNALFGKEPMPELKNTVMEERILVIRDLYKKMTAENYLAKGYGVPLEEEFVMADPETIKLIQEEIKTNMEGLKDIAMKFFPKEVEEMKGTMENRHWILEKMNAL